MLLFIELNGFRLNERYALYANKYLSTRILLKEFLIKEILVIKLHMSTVKSIYYKLLLKK